MTLLFLSAIPPAQNRYPLQAEPPQIVCYRGVLQLRYLDAMQRKCLPHSKRKISISRLGNKVLHKNNYLSKFVHTLQVMPSRYCCSSVLLINFMSFNIF